MDRKDDGLKTRLRQARKVAGLTQNQVASAIGRRRESVSRYELGLTRPDSGDLKRLALLYGVSADWLLFGDGTAPGEAA